MGRTPKPLKLLVHYSLMDAHPWHELVAQGHLVVFTNPDEGWNARIGLDCWYMDAAHLKYLDLALAAARARAYPKEAANEQAPPSPPVQGVVEQAAPPTGAQRKGRPPEGA